LWVLLLVLVLVVGWGTRAEAQLLVQDNANLVQNIVQAIQTVLMVANQILELTGLGEIVLGEDLSSEYTQLGEIMVEARGLSADIQTIQTNVTLLFDLNTAPDGSTELRARLARIRTLTMQIYLDAIRTQALLQSTISALRHLVRLTEAIGDFLGNMQGNQTLAQLDAKLTVELLKLKTSTEAYQRAHVIHQMEEPFTIHTLYRIQSAISVDYPRAR
jgi:conjugal transfer/entry exclusion protein